MDQSEYVKYARSLMAGDKASLKAGYAPENAVLAVAAVYSLSVEEALAVAEQVGANQDTVKKCMASK